MSKKTSRRTFGTISELPSGNYRARYRADVDGGWITAPSTFPGTREGLTAAEHWLDAEKVKVNRGLGSLALGTVAEIVEEYVTSRENEPDERDRLAPRSAESYRSISRLYIEPTRLGRMNASSVIVRDVRQWWTALGKTTTTAQAKNAYRLLSAAFGRLVEDDVIDASPVRIKKASKAVPKRQRVATEAEIVSIIEALDPRYRFYVTLAANVGPRRGELRGLRRCDFEIGDGFASVSFSEQLHDDGRRGPLKGRPAEPVKAYLPPHIVPALVEHLEAFVGPEPDAYVFTGARGGPLSPRVFWDKWQEAQEAAGIPEADRLHVHDLRRTAITAADDAGIPAAVSMALYGHSNLSTHRGYQVATDDAKRKAAEAVSARRSQETG